MSDQKHTEEPWEPLLLSDSAEVRAHGCVVADIQCGSFVLGDGTKHIITLAECHANANRVAASMNSLKGLNPSAVPGLVATMEQMVTGCECTHDEIQDDCSCYVCMGQRALAAAKEGE